MPCSEPASRQNGRASTPLQAPLCAGAEDSELDAYKERLGSARSIPEQCFGGSHLCLAHGPSGVRLAFTALDALQAWRDDDRPPVQVGAAQDWLRSRQKDVESSGAVTLEYDWSVAPASLSASAPYH